MGSERSRIQTLLKNVRESAATPDKVYHVGELGPNEAVLAETGIGKVNAAIGAVELIRAWHPDCLISTGVAGGIDPSLGVMDVVAGAEVIYHDVDCGPGNKPGQVQGLPPSFAGDPRLLACAKSIRAESKVAAGLICSGDQFVTDREQLEAIKARHPAGLAVDMESGALAQVCHLYGVPFLSFRILSDTPGAKGHFNQYMDFWRTMADRSFAVTEAFLTALPAEL
jgi:adenosylhomocysteine nucleosidase